MLTLSQIITSEVRQALLQSGYDIVRIGDVPPWMEGIESMPGEVYRRMLIVDE